MSSPVSRPDITIPEEARRAGTTTCTNCGRYLALITNPEGGPLLTFDFECDGYTPSRQRHACGEVDRALHGLGR